MVNQRDRINKLKTFLENSGIIVNIGKNKARGNKGIFLTKNGEYRIDISKSCEGDALLHVLLHEYAHFLHYKNDKSLSSFNFLFPVFNEKMQEELLEVSVRCVPKGTASALFKAKNDLKAEIYELSKKIKDKYFDFKISTPYKPIEKTICKPYSYLLRYDCVRYSNELISVKDITENESDLNSAQILYIKLKSKQRMLKRINSRITRLNSYYNKPTELVARFVEQYFTSPENIIKLAPKCCAEIQKVRKNNYLPEFNNLCKIFEN